MIVPLCTFEVGGSRFGIPVGDVAEVIRGHRVTPVPLAPTPVAGLINLRGRVVTALDLRRRLRPDGFEPGRTSGGGVVLAGAGGAVCLLVDQLGDVVEVDGETFEAPPESLGGVGRELIAGAYRSGGEPLLVLDVGEAVAVVGAGGKHATDAG